MHRHSYRLVTAVAGLIAFLGGPAAAQLGGQQPMYTRYNACVDQGRMWCDLEEYVQYGIGSYSECISRMETACYNDAPAADTHDSWIRFDTYGAPVYHYTWPSGDQAN